MKHQQPPKIMVREIKQALQHALQAANCPVYWVQAIGEDSMKAPIKVWPFELDPLYNVVIRHEGQSDTIVLITAQASRYEPEKAIPLISIKLECSNKKALKHVPAIFDFLARIDSVRAEIIAKSIQKRQMTEAEFIKLHKIAHMPIFDVSKGGFVLVGRPDLGSFPRSYVDALKALAAESDIELVEADSEVVARGAWA